MTITEEEIRERCTDAVFERGRDYRADGRIHRIERFGDHITAAVRGSQLYDVTVVLSGTEFDSNCTCPYDGPGECKHVVAVLLDVVADPPMDESADVEAILEGVSSGDLHSFVTDELARDPGMRDRFRARFGDGPGKSADEYRAEIDRLFDEHTDDYPVVVEAIDFSRFTDLAEEYRDRGRYRAAATVSRALAEGIERNMDLVDAAYDHYVQTFQRALDRYVECVEAADLSEQEYETHADVLSTRGSDAVDYLAERYTAAFEELQSRYRAE